MILTKPSESRIWSVLILTICDAHSIYHTHWYESTRIDGIVSLTTLLRRLFSDVFTTALKIGAFSHALIYRLPTRSNLLIACPGCEPGAEVMTRCCLGAQMEDARGKMHMVACLFSLLPLISIAQTSNIFRPG